MGRRKNLSFIRRRDQKARGTDPPTIRDWRWRYPTRKGALSWKKGKWLQLPFVKGVGLV